MREAEATYCSKCTMRPAVNFIRCRDTGRSLQLCDDCLKREDPIAAEAKNATCQYCGEPRCSGKPDVMADLAGLWRETSWLWLCESCSAEYYSFITERERAIAQRLSFPEQLEQRKKIVALADSHLKELVARRDN